MILPRSPRLALAAVLPLSASLVLATSCGAPPPAAAPMTGGSQSVTTSDPGATTVKVEAPSEDDLPIPIGTNDPVWGSRRAYVTVVLFSDFQCPFCARIAPTLAALREKYGPDQLRIVWKHQPLPFHARALPAAEAAQGAFALAGNDAFWKFHDAAFANQQNLTDEAFEQWADSAGVPASRFRRGVADRSWEAKVRADMALAARLKVNGTPTSFINGRPLGGAQPLEKFTALIDEELAKAKEKEKAGTVRDRIYAVVSAENVAAQPPEKDPDEEGEREDTKTVFKIPVGASPSLGSAAALVTIVEFSDFECPYCKKVQETLKRVQSTYGDKVRIVWKNEPLSFHPRAVPAAMLALEARAQKGDKGFWAAHDEIFASNPQLEEPDLERIAKSVGLNVPKALTAIKTGAHKASLERDTDLADDFQASGTPHFFINGRRLVGAQPFEKFQAIIDEEIVRAKAVLAKGTPPAAIYDALVKDGKAAPEPETRTVPLLAGAPSKGPANAAVVIQEFSDFQCPFCSRVQDVLAEVMKTYPGKVRIVWRDLPLPMHKDAPIAAEAARAALAQKGEAGFWKMHDRLFGEQRSTDGLGRDALDRYAREQGLDATKWKTALDAHTHKPAVDADARLAADVGITGTPSFVITTSKGGLGYFVSGAQPFPKFKRLIDRVLRDGAPKPKAPDAKTGAAAGAQGDTKLQIVDSVVGKGAETHNGDIVMVHYVGRLTDGTEFDASRPRGEPFQFTLGKGQVIKGWDQGLLGMKVGGKRTITIPASLGYGDRGAPPKIPPGSTLKFDVELIQIH